MKTLILLLLSIGSLCAQPFYVFDTNSFTVGIPNRGLFTFYDYQQIVVPGTNVIRIANTMPNLPIQWTKMSGGQVVAVTAVESNLFLALMASNSNWQSASVNTNLTNAVSHAAEFERTNASNIFDKATDERNRIIRAVVFITLNEINILRTNHLSLTNFPARTTNQLILAVSNSLFNATQ